MPPPFGKCTTKIRARSSHNPVSHPCSPERRKNAGCAPNFNRDALYLSCRRAPFLPSTPPTPVFCHCNPCTRTRTETEFDRSAPTNAHRTPLTAAERRTHCTEEDEGHDAAFPGCSRNRCAMVALWRSEEQERDEPGSDRGRDNGGPRRRARISTRDDNNPAPLLTAHP